MTPTDAPLSVRSHVIHSLREAIMSGALKPGARLSDGRLCEELGVSRTSIREAMRYLESDKLITVMGNRRACVTKLTPQQAQTIYALLARLTGDAAALLARNLNRRTAAVMQGMLEQLQRHQDAGRAADQRAQITQFFELVLEACADTVLREIGGQLLLRVGYLQSLALAGTPWRAASVAGLQALASACARHDQDDARAAAQAYFRDEVLCVAGLLA